MSMRLSGLKGVDGVNLTLHEVDQETESVKVTIEGPSVNYPSVEETLREMGAVIHSVDLVSTGSVSSRTCGPRKTTADGGRRGSPLPGLLDPLGDLLDDRGLVVVRPHEDPSFLPPGRRGEGLAVLHLWLEAEGLRGARDLLRGRRVDRPSLRDPTTLIPRPRDIEVGGIEDDRSVAFRHGLGPNVAVAIRIWPRPVQTICSFLQLLSRNPFRGSRERERRNGPRGFCG